MQQMVIHLMNSAQKRIRETANCRQLHTSTSTLTLLNTALRLLTAGLSHLICSAPFLFIANTSVMA